MANRTDPSAAQVHSTNPQFLIEKILRNRIYESLYWKQYCFALSAETVIDRAVEINYIGGRYSHNIKPTPFICLVLKLLQIQPEREIIYSYINQEDHKYLRVLGAFYLRLVGRPEEIFTHLEPLYNDFRKISFRSVNGWEIKYIDEFVEELLHSPSSCDTQLPRLPKREVLEEVGKLPPRESLLDDEKDDLRKAMWEQALQELQNEYDLPTILKAIEDEKEMFRTLSKGKRTRSGSDSEDLEYSTGRSRHDSKYREGSIEYWNAVRAKVGLGPLK